MRRLRCGRRFGRFIGVAALLLAGISAADQPNKTGTAGAEPLPLKEAWAGSLDAGRRRCWLVPDLKAGHTYAVSASLRAGDLGNDDRVALTLRDAGGRTIRKDLHAGDPDIYCHFRPATAGKAELRLDAAANRRPVPVEVVVRELPMSPEEAVAFDPGPNDLDHAAPLVLGRSVYGAADEVDYLDNRQEGTAGLRWFRIDYADDKPALVYFYLDVLDRDVSVNLRFYRRDPQTGRIGFYPAKEDGSQARYEPAFADSGIDPMEIIHDREGNPTRGREERYSKHISRVLTRGTYYLEVSANHPDFVLRTRKLPVPPYEDPHDAVEAGMQYIMNVGDAWFAQVPREGAIYRRVQNIHDTGTRCTACHPSVFSTESNLVAHRNGYPIRSKENFQYVVNRIYNSIAPLYGQHGLYYQRFISLPFQSQGKQGGILKDFEAEVSDVESKTFLRFGPFLKAAWETRTELPPDELNGVVPRDSKFGFSWRDWRVLGEVARRTGDPAYAAVTEHVARLLTRPESREQIAEQNNPYGRSTAESQDRMHRLYGLALIDPAGRAEDIRAECASLLALQNPDGGWPETVTKGDPSAVYATGQMLVSLMTAGVPAADPRLQRGFRYLLGQQLSFGGWFQTTTSENFRTPMRETRYAVEALAMAFPRRRPDGKIVSRGWGNRDERPARLPRTDTLLHTLDDLDNLWEVPKAEQKKFVAAVARLLDHEQPPVRAQAAACLGRIAVGCPEAVGPLVRQLNHPNKVVWRAAAWALRSLGNFGTGVEEIKEALDTPDSLVRRGACRVFAYQFFGMDERLDLCRRLMELTADADLWTRLQAIKTLRQWFYRTADAATQRQIVDTYIRRMGVAGEAGSVRDNLAQGMYIMLDENLGGGVSLANNLASLPPAERERANADRKEVEKSVLLRPIFEAMVHGNALQRQALLQSFDGSFLKGRFYARNPRDMIDVGNDREFGFLHEPPQELLDRTFRAVLAHADEPAVRLRALELADFFHLPARSADGGVQRFLLEALRDGDPKVRSAAARIASTSLALSQAEKDPGQVALIREVLRENGTDRVALLTAVGRNPALLRDAGLREDVRALVREPDAWRTLSPLLSLPVFSDREVLDLVHQGWPRAGDVKERVALLDALGSRRALVDRREPSEKALLFLRRGATDPAVPVRERTFNLLASMKTLWATPVAGRLLYIGLADDSPTIRLQCLKLSADNPGLWERAETEEYILRLLVDPDRKIRAEAVVAVERHRAFLKDTRFLRRLKGVMADPDGDLRARAEKLMRSAGAEPGRLSADAVVQRPRMLNLSYFRRDVNPIFYRPGRDGQSCAQCHVNHTILRLAEPPAPGKEVGPEGLVLNYSSVMKVINLGDPEQSLVLRKPRSPHGQGLESADSPTGVTHVGGPRWEGTDSDAYQKMLAWIRSAGAAAGGAEHFTASADSYSPDYPPALALDGDAATFWHTEYLGAVPGYPHELVIDLGRLRGVGGLLYVPRTDGSPNGRVKDYEVYGSEDGKHWGKALARGTWANDGTTKYAALPATKARYVKLRGLSEVNGLPVMSAAEVVVDVEEDAGK